MSTAPLGFRLFVRWTDARGMRQHHGRLRPEWLEVVPEQEHRRAEAELRDSGWQGFPNEDEFLSAWRADPHPYHRLDRLPMQSCVRWRGPLQIANRLGLQPRHPGRLDFADETHAVITWVDSPGVLQYGGRLDPEWLEPISEEEFSHDADELRGSGWTGFPSRDGQAMAGWTENPWPPRVETHPGTVIDSGEKHAVVQWVDRVGTFEHDGIMWPEWLEAIDEQDFLARAQGLRASGWRGIATMRERR